MRADNLLSEHGNHDDNSSRGWIVVAGVGGRVWIHSIPYTDDDATQNMVKVVGGQGKVKTRKKVNE